MTVLVTGGAGYIGSHMVLELVDAGERVIVLDNLSTGHDWAVPPGVPLVIGDSGDQDLVGRLLRDEADRRDHPFRRLDRGSGFGARSARLLSQQYGEHARADRMRGEQAGVRNFIFSSTAAVYGNPAEIPVTENAALQPISPYGWSKLMSEMMLRDAGRAHELHSRHSALLQCGRRRSALPRRSIEQSGHASDQGRGRRRPSACAPSSRCSATDYPTPDGTCVRDYIHVSDLARAHSDALRHLRAGGPSLTLNCGYGHGFSVLDVIETVKRVSGVDFKVEIAPRRDGDPAQIVADSHGRRARRSHWQPRFDDLSTIVAHALAWEHALIKRRQARRKAPISARRQVPAVPSIMKQLDNSARAGAW